MKDGRASGDGLEHESAAHTVRASSFETAKVYDAHPAIISAASIYSEKELTKRMDPKLRDGFLDLPRRGRRR